MIKRIGIGNADKTFSGRAESSAGNNGNLFAVKKLFTKFFA